MEPTWLEDRTWTPFLEDGTLPIRYRAMPWVASRYTFDETCRILKIRRISGPTLQHAYDLWSWFSAPLRLRELKARSSEDGDSADDRIDFEGWPIRERKILGNVKIGAWDQLGERYVIHYLKIETWSQLANLTIDELSSQYGCGATTLSGIVARLEARGLRLREG